MLIAAIDPGLQGGVGKILTNASLIGFEWRPIPIVRVRLGKRGKLHNLIDASLVEQFLCHSATPYDIMVLEQQSPRPHEGTVSAFTAGRNLGMEVATVLHVPVRLLVMPHPTVWKKDLGVPADKKEATAICREIFGPASPEKDGPAEALLLAYWAKLRRDRHGERAFDDCTVEPRPVRYKVPFLVGHDPRRSGSVGGRYQPSHGRAAGRLFTMGDRLDGGQARARRRSRRPRAGRAGDQDDALPQA